jgi:hypothetical protein
MKFEAKPGDTSQRDTYWIFRRPEAGKFKYEVLENASQNELSGYLINTGLTQAYFVVKADELPALSVTVNLAIERQFGHSNANQ